MDGSRFVQGMFGGMFLMIDEGANNNGFVHSSLTAFCCGDHDVRAVMRMGLCVHNRDMNENGKLP